MALRAVDDHPKLHDLKSILSIGRGEALGYLEALWHFTGRFTPAGNIGAYSDTAIESWIEWKGAPGALMAALVQSKWIDANETHRLVIHDWHDHADDATKLALKRKKIGFVTCPDLSRHVPDNIPTQSGLPGAGAGAGAEPGAGPEFALTAGQGPAVTAAYLPLVTGEEFPIEQARFDSWVKTFPGVDVAQEIAKMRVWLDANPTRRVTRVGVLRFAVNWLSKEQDRGAHRKGGMATHGSGNRSQARTDANIEAARRVAASIGGVIAFPGGSAASLT
jgi:hypothetical protein